MLLEAHMKLCLTEVYFAKKYFLHLKLGKCTKNGLKTGFFEFIEELGH